MGLFTKILSNYFTLNLGPNLQFIYLQALVLIIYLVLTLFQVLKTMEKKFFNS